jgi:hypothetical protein
VGTMQPPASHFGSSESAIGTMLPIRIRTLQRAWSYRELPAAVAKSLYQKRLARNPARRNYGFFAAVAPVRWRR